ncbi:MAG: hypothetical protein CMK44_04810 [Porticoccus sp.]|jgi:hypothetical protein|nr:hypothetical protein [Porticoccus sp.]
MKILLIPLLLIFSILFFVVNVHAKTYNKNAHGKKIHNTNISGLVVKDLHCLYSGNYSGRLVNLNNYPLKNKSINITMYDSGGDRVGIQSSRLKPINEKESKDFHTVRSNFCKDNYVVVIGVDLYTEESN